MSESVHVRQGRVNQRKRTRDAILEAGSGMLRSGATPSVVDAAAAAHISQATAYRYFPTQESLLAAVVDRQMQSALQSLDRSFETAGDPEQDVVQLAEAIFDEIILREPEHRSLLRLALDQWFLHRRGHGAGNTIERGGRIAFVVQALEPLRPKLGEAGFFQLAEAVSLAIGIEAQLVLRDAWDLPKNQALEVIRWTCKALIRQALVEAKSKRRSTAAASAEKRALERSRRRRTDAAAERKY